MRKPPWKTQVYFQQNGSTNALCRIGTSNPTRTPIGVPGEGFWAKQADISSIVCQVFDLDCATPDVPVATPSVPLSSILDTPVTNDRTLWTADNVGFNFQFMIPGSCFPVGSNHRYEVKFHFACVDGSTFSFEYDGPCQSS